MIFSELQLLEWASEREAEKWCW